MTVNQALSAGTSLLTANDPGKANIETPGLDASLLLAEVLGTDRSGLIIKGNEEIKPGNNECYLELIRRRLDGECVAYILGRKEFYGLDFIVNPTVLVPRPETEILVEACLERIKMLREQNSNPVNLKILDLCTGSGAIAIALKHEVPDLEVWATDISRDALNVARNNCLNLISGINQSGKNHSGSGNPNADTASINFIQSNLFENINGTFDMIVSNPPYILSCAIKTLAPEIHHEPRLALDGGEDGLGIIKRIIQDAGEYLTSGGFLLLEADPGQFNEIERVLIDNNFGDFQIIKDLMGNKRTIKCRKEILFF